MGVTAGALAAGAPAEASKASVFGFDRAEAGAYLVDPYFDVPMAAFPYFAVPTEVRLDGDALVASAATTAGLDASVAGVSVAAAGAGAWASPGDGRGLPRDGAA